MPSRGELAHHLQHLADQLGIERGGRLVEQHQRGLHRQRAGDRDALLLAARQHLRVDVALVRQPDLVEQRQCVSGARLGARLSQHLDRADARRCPARSDAGTG